ncbi:MAG: LysR substrate-binding domain-containing protein [Xanthomonadales bacterium]|nr:LysR substrate-binding domain-containing protein [Xanthomonadales bacterium]
MNKLTAIRYFCKVVENGGFAAAARKLHTTRATVNKYVVYLEDDLGVPLLLRSTRKVSPTDAGLRFYQRCVKILEDLEEAEAQASSGRDAPVGRLRVNAPLAFGTRYIGPYLCDFISTYDKVEVQLNLTDRFIDLLEDDYDLTIRISNDSDAANLVIKDICPIRILVCASPDYLRKHGEPGTPEDLLDHTCLQFGHSLTGRKWVLGSHEVIPSGPICCNEPEVLREAALANLGIVALPNFMVGPDLQEGMLRTILTDYPIPPRSLQAIYPFHRQVSDKVTTFINGLIDRFAERPPWDLID